MLQWIEIDRAALLHNFSQLNKRAGDSGSSACPVIKANAYGHGLVEVASLLVRGGVLRDGGASQFAVNALFEARALRDAGISVPVLLLGYVPLEDLGEAVRLGVQLTVYNSETILRLEEICARDRGSASVHVKIETGNYRQGVHLDELESFLKIFKSCPHVRLTALSTHFSNIEDTTDYSYAKRQLEIFSEADALVRSFGFRDVSRHCANSAATILFPETHFDMVRAGIALYGLWPSKETRVSASERGTDVVLRSVLSWKAVVAQVKKVPNGAAVGYGCTYVARRNMRIAILPVGYFDGYDRGLSNSGAVLIRGQRAPVIGRVCMNMMMADVTEIADVAVEDVATLIGRDGDGEITADEVAGWSGTINYEVVSRIREGISRVVV